MTQFFCSVGRPRPISELQRARRLNTSGFARRFWPRTANTTSFHALNLILILFNNNELGRIL